MSDRHDENLNEYLASRIAKAQRDEENQSDDIAFLFALAGRQPLVTLTAARAKRLIECVRDCAMEAECMGEMSGYRVTILERHGLTDSSDPAFGPVKYPDQGKPPGDVLPF